MNGITITIIAMTWFIGFALPAFFAMSDFYLDKKYKGYHFTKRGLFLLALVSLPFIHGILTFLIGILLTFKIGNLYDNHKQSIKKLLFKNGE